MSRQSPVTAYRYRQPVAFGEHPKMLRPRDDNDQKVLQSALEISPKPRKLAWGQDRFGNYLEVQEASAHRNVSHVRAPDLVRPIDGQMAKQIWPYPVLGVWFAGLWPLVDRRQTHLQHQPTDTMAPNAPAVAAQMPRHLP